MSQKLTDTIVKALPLPAKGNRIHYDIEVKGFGCRVTAAGARSFVLNYRTRAGRERRYTIGSHPDWKTSAARDEAKSLKKRIDVGEDPVGEVEADRTAKTVADLCDRYCEEHLPRKRKSSAADDRAMIARYIKQDGEKAARIKPELKHLKVPEVTFSDIDGLHRAITRRGHPYQANRVLALLSKMFSLALKLKWRSAADGNPCRGVERNHEERRERYLSVAELGELTKALAEHEDQQAANIVRMLLLTGARRGEVQSMQWTALDLEAGVWTKPSAHTKQKKTHRVPLSPPARLLLAGIRTSAEVEAERTGKDVGPYVFPGRTGGHRVEMKSQWRRLCVKAGIVTTETAGKRTIVKPSARLHDLRHTYASVLASAGLSLPIIGALLGHTQAQTTARYAHLFDDPLRAATERVGAIVMPDADRPQGEVVPMKGGA